ISLITRSYEGKESSEIDRSTAEYEGGREIILCLGNCSVGFDI
ncbi:unnamed protein product, partial [Rotaria sp. Silwood1]